MRSPWILASSTLLGALLGACAAAAVQPGAPTQICANGQCVTSPVIPPTPPTPPSGKSIKWNPGHYMDSESVIRAGTTISKVTYELNDLNNQDKVLGFRVNVTWGALEPTMGNYNFAVLDAILARLKTGYNMPKHLVIYMWLYNNGAMGQGDGSTVPLYIQKNPQYGASPVSGGYGWWGYSTNGVSTGMYAPPLYYPPVMDRLIALIQAIGAHYDSDPNVEAIDFQEDATIAQAASAGGLDPHYSDAAWLTQIQRMLTAATAAFPHTSVVMDNSWFDRPPQATVLQQWMVANRIAPGAADSWGQSALTAFGTSHLSDGIQTLLGADQKNGGTIDLRPRTRAMIAVEGPDIMGPYFGKYGGPWTPLDIINAANQTYFASHVFWTHLVGTESFRGVACPPAAKWSNLAVTLAANPLIHTDYPANYP